MENNPFAAGIKSNSGFFIVSMITILGDFTIFVRENLIMCSYV